MLGHERRAWLLLQSWVAAAGSFAGGVRRVAPAKQQCLWTIDGYSLSSRFWVVLLGAAHVFSSSMMQHFRVLYCLP